MRTIDAIKTNRRAIICECCDKSRIVVTVHGFPVPSSPCLVCMRVRMCEQVCVIEANSLQLRVITIGLYQFLSRSPSCQILAVCGRRLRGVSGSWFPRFLSPAAFLDSDRRRLVCPLLPCATRLSPYGKLRFCLRKAPRLPTEAPPLCLRKAPFSFSLRITSCNKLSFSATESSRLHCDNSLMQYTYSGKVFCYIWRALFQNAINPF